MSHPARRVVTVGLHVADVLGRYVDAIPPGQGLALLDEIRLTVAGTAAATAVDLARLGVPVATVGAVGADALGVFLRSTMADEGVDVTGLAVRRERPTSATMLPIRRDGSRPALHVIGSNAAIAPEDLASIDMSDVAVLHLGGTCLLPGIDGAPSVDLLRRARDAGVVTTMDFIPTGGAGDRDAVLPCLPFVDYLFPSEEDALSFAGAATLDEAITFYLGAGVGTLVITRGAAGVSISTRESRDVRRAAYSVDVVDTTGCGDAFSAGFIEGLVSGADVAEAAERGLACGSLVATGLGSDAGLHSAADVARLRAEGVRGAV
ncbi:sugar/nucleoside kinase (ribokinase family) [Microbacterium proteolyticum]|uniref:Sugar/nucleoside kinase (Ribokinase family) n=1 Tax=Microbacterium proteolyticum TaxID=1572644 RepID=A0A7W5CHU3_9MICO|nr:sugar kinase [Microbacterium proteolyticum]MBB3157936.1 sugar/nucleoside kinase (ribokinase family) [Microbacterium proteolyticum]